MINSCSAHLIPSIEAKNNDRPTPAWLISFRENYSLLLITIMFSAGCLLAWMCGIPVSGITKGYSYNVLVILIVMELFTNLIAETGIMQLLAVKLAEMSGGKRRNSLILFGGMMFLISAFLNNITAVMMILPIVFVLLKALDVDRKYVNVFFATILALSNTGGAASPIGDFPAIVIMTSGITSFLGYLSRALPLFALTSIALLLLWSSQVKKDSDDGAIRKLAVINLKSQYRNIRVRMDVLCCIAVVFAGMFLAWSFVPRDVLPPEVIAILGYGLAMVICLFKGIHIQQKMDLKSALTIASFLFVAEVISQTGFLNMIAGYLQDNIANQKALIILIILITALAAGCFSAGPAAAAMMPIIVNICDGPLKDHSDWIAVAYAAAICAGSSLFMWSATAGFILSGKVNDAALAEEDNARINWGSAQYWKYGITNFAVQLFIAIAAAVIFL